MQVEKPHRSVRSAEPAPRLRTQVEPSTLNSLLRSSLELLLLKAPGIRHSESLLKLQSRNLVLARNSKSDALFVTVAFESTVHLARGVRSWRQVRVILP